MESNNQSPSVRPKIRSSIGVPKNESEGQYEPMEKRRIMFLDRNRTRKPISLISKEFCLKLNCIHYYEPPFSDGNIDPKTMNLWLLNCKKFQRFIQNIIQLSYFRFWSTLAYNQDVNDAIESYLSYAVRPYRIHTIPPQNEIRNILKTTHSLVFALFIRILISKESPKTFMSEEYHSELLFKNGILNMVKILDLLQLYGYGSNAELLRILLKKILEKKLTVLTPQMMTIFAEIKEYFNQFDVEDHDLKANIFPSIFNVTDVLFSLNKLILIEHKIANVCQQANLIQTVVEFYSKFFPFIENELDSLLKTGSINEYLFRHLKFQIGLAKACFMMYFHQCIRYAFVEPLISLSDEEKMPLFDGLMCILNILANEKKFSLDYFSRFPFEKEFEPLFQNRELNDRLSIGDALLFYQTSINDAIEEQKKLKEKPENSDVNFFQENLVSNTPVQREEKSGVKVRNDPDTVAKEQFMLEMFPDFGDGFIYKCLEYFDFNSERVIDAIFVGNLPPELESLNRKLKKSDLINKPTNIEMGLENVNYAADAKKFDPVTKTNYELTDIFIGKKDKINAMNAVKNVNKEKTMKLVEKMNMEEEMLKENIKTMLEKGKLHKEELGNREEFMGINLYDDEFDDTYDNEEEFDIEPKNLEDTDDDSDDSDGGDQENVESTQQLAALQTSSSGGAPNQGKFRTNEKYENCARYFRKQLYNRRNHQRGQRGGGRGGSIQNNENSGRESRTEQPTQNQSQNQQHQTNQSMASKETNAKQTNGVRGGGGANRNKTGNRGRPGNSNQSNNRPSYHNNQNRTRRF